MDRKAAHTRIALLRRLFWSVLAMETIMTARWLTTLLYPYEMGGKSKSLVWYHDLTINLKI